MDTRIRLTGNTSFKLFPFNNFTYYLTLFSKFFSSFPHGTCSLSVSRPIFSFRWNLPPILGCIPKQPDSLRTYHNDSRNPKIMYGIITLYDWRRGALFQETYTLPSRIRKRFSKLQFGGLNTPRFKIWAFPTSLAVTMGILVSFFSSAYWYA